MPDDMLPTLNQVEQLKKNMWDTKGKPIPIALFIKPTPLPPISRYGEDTPVAVLSYLRTGKSSVFGFNQQPEWQPFTVQWWENQEASVGVSFAARGDSSDGYGTITGPISGWSFYRLLQKGTEPGPNLFAGNCGYLSARRQHQCGIFISERSMGIVHDKENQRPFKPNQDKNLEDLLRF